MSQQRIRTAAAAAVLALTLATTACAGSTSTAESSAPAADSAPASETPAPKPTPVSLEGEWEQSNSQSPDSWMAATVTGDTITVNWVLNNGETTALYWAGTVAVPADGSTAFSWTSTADLSQTENALMASSDAAKDFTYDNGAISYVVTIQGQSATVELAPAG